jgi:hypothetical protein
LAHEHLVGARRRAHDAHTARRQVDDERRVVRYQATPRPHFRREEIRARPLSQCIVAIETTDKLTDPQIVAKVKEHYGIDR